MTAETQPFAEITVTELKARLDKGEKPLLIDVREPFEWKIANLGDYGAKMIPMRELPEHLEELPRDQEIILYCRSGSRSANMAAWLASQGFEQPVNLKGGILAWAREIDPSVQTY